MALFSTNKWSSYKDATSLVDYARSFYFLFEVGIIVSDAAGQFRQCHWPAGSPMFSLINIC